MRAQYSRAMRAIVVEDERMRLAEVPDPELRPGDLLVAVKAAGGNRADLLQRRGGYPPPKGESGVMGLGVARGGLEPAPRRGGRGRGRLAGGGDARKTPG